VDPRVLPDLLVFLEVVRSGSLTRAAERLHTVQPNVTARIKSLERAVGAALLVRHARGVRPTPAGEVALALAQRTSTVLDDLRFSFGQGARKTVVKLRLGAIETVAASHLPRLVSAFARRHPQVDVSVQAGSSAALLQQLGRAELDVVFVSRRSKLAGFRQRVVFRDELVVVAPASVESLADLAAAESAEAPVTKVLVQRLGCSFTERLLTYLAQTCPRRPRLLEIGTLEGIVGLVEAGMGIAAMPRAFVASLARGRAARLLELPRALRRLNTYLVAPAGADASLATRDFVAFASKSEC
jgi:LysR family transcriptional regulator, cell division regulator